MYRPEGLRDDLGAPGDEHAPAATVAGSPAPAEAGGGGPQRPVGAAGLGWRGWLRWVWRQLTSMRVALLLLMLLAVAALPGAFFPQEPQDPTSVARYRADKPGLAPWLDRLGMFDVFAAPWFVAIYLLLFVSLIGCILPRTRSHLRALRAAPPRVPKRFDRFPVREQVTTRASREEIEAGVLARLRGRYRTATSAAGISAERGYLRETGNLVFHLSLVGVLVALGAGQVLSYRGQAVVVEGRSFANSIVDYDSFHPGSLFDVAELPPFTFRLENLDAQFTWDARAEDFTADVTVREPGGQEYADVIRPNHPIDAAGARIYLSGNGYAPLLTVHDGEGEVAFSQPVPFLPEDGVYTSRGVVKVPDVADGLDQLGFTGFFLPSAVIDPDGGMASVHPAPNSPLLVLTLYRGDLGLDGGVPQNVYELDTGAMTQVMEDDGAPAVILLEPGQEVELPDGLGTIAFEELPRFAALDLRHDPTLGWLLLFALTATAGLAASLFVPRRRLWVRTAETEDGRRLVTVAALARGDDPGLAADARRAIASIPGADDAIPGDDDAAGLRQEER